MPESVVTSNFVKFNKNQKALIEKFGLAVNSGVSDIVNAVFHVAADQGFQDFPDVTGSTPNSPARIKGQLIINPVQPYSTYKKFKERGNKKKFVNRTGELKKVFSAFNAVKGYYKSDQVKAFMVSKGRLRFGFAGRALRILLSSASKNSKAITKRRPVVLAMSKVRIIAKKLIAQNIKVAMKNA